MARVIVTGGQVHATLAVCRSLALRGHEVTLIGPRRLAPAMRSRSVAHRVRIDLDRIGSVVGDLWRSGRYDAVIPGTDDDLLVLAEAFAGAAPPGIASVAGATAVLDRDRIADAVRAAGIRVPELITCTNAAELRSAGDAVGFPLMVKPVQVVATANDRVSRRGAQLADDGASALEAAEAIGWPVHVQQVIHGSVGSLSGLMVEGELVAYVAARNVRIWPVDAGNASLAVTVPAPPELVGDVARIVRDLGHEGIFQLECIWQPDGTIAPIDLNPRPYGSLALAVAAGADLPGLWIDWLLDGRRPAEPVVGRPGVWFRWEECEVRYFLRELRAGRPLAAAAILRPHRRTTHLLLSLRDPGPFVAFVLVVAKGVPGKIRSRFF